MPEKEKTTYRYFVNFVIFIFVIIALFLLFEPVLTILFTGIILTYISFPLYKKLKSRFHNHVVPGLVTVLVIVFILSLPFAYVVYETSNQAQNLYSSITNESSNGAFDSEICQGNQNFCRNVGEVENGLKEAIRNLGLQSYLKSSLSRFMGVLENYLIKIPQAIIGLGFALLIVYFLLRDGKYLKKRVLNWLPLESKNKERLVKRFEEITYSIVFVQLFVALAQGVVSFIGYWLFGLPLPVFWAVMTAFSALIPIIGTGLIWGPGATFLILVGLFTEDQTILLQGIGLMAYGIFVISTTDNILRVKFLEKRVEINPMLTIVGIVGGVSLFGVMGIFIGPIAIELLLTYLDEFQERYK